MSHNTGVLAVSAFVPKTTTRVGEADAHNRGWLGRSANIFATPSDNTCDTAAPTKRFNAIDLATALAAMDQADSVDEESTLTVNPEDHRTLLASTRGAESTFRGNTAQRPSTDDEPTLDVPSPPIPEGIPSPLGDDDDAPPIAAGEIPKWLPNETLSLDDLGLAFDDELPLLTGGASIGPESEPAVIGEPLSPETGKGVRSNRQALRVERASGRPTRSILMVFWTITVAIAAVFTYVLVTAASSSADDPPETTTETTERSQR
jgi:hypothetical protein